MAESVPEISSLERMTRRELLAEWLRIFGENPPTRTSCELLAYEIAWTIQTKKQGGLSAKTRRSLNAMVADLEAGKPARPAGTSARVRPGTTLIKEWRGKKHRVVALERGFAFDGQTYKSLSEIARAITGTHWNGPAFFGLRNGHGRKAEVGNDGD